MVGLSKTAFVAPAASVGWIAAFAFMVLSLPALSAGGAGDGTASSSWMDDSRLLPALGAVREEDYPRAIKLLEEIVYDRPELADAWNYLGFSLRKTGEFEKSEEAYLTALRLDPEHRGVHEYLGELYLQTGRRDEAKAMAEKLASLCRYGCPELTELRAALESAAKDVRNP